MAHPNPYPSPATADRGPSRSQYPSTGGLLHTTNCRALPTSSIRLGVEYEARGGSRHPSSEHSTRCPRTRGIPTQTPSSAAIGWLEDVTDEAVLDWSHLAAAR